MTQWMIMTLGLATVGQVVYQISQRAVPRDAQPLVVLAVAYFAASVLCIALAWPLGAWAGGLRLRSALSWPTWMIALSIVAIEVGYLTAYRSGWTLGTAFAVGSISTIFTLALFGRIVFGNPLPLRQLIGLALSALAVWLLATGPRVS